MNLKICKKISFFLHKSFFFFYLARTTLKTYTMKKLLFTAVALTAFSGVALANNKLETVSEFNQLKVVSIADQKEQPDAWFCYKISETTSVNDFNGVITVTTTYKCTWYDLSVAAISQE